MFDGLDDINWDGLGDVHLSMYTKMTDVPTHIRDLLHDDSETRERAIQNLLGEGQHLGMLSRATPHIVPFVLEVLESYPDYAERGYLILGVSTLLDQVFRRKSIAHMRLAIATFDEITAGYEIYKRLLHDPDFETRLYTVDVMAQMQDHALDALSMMVERLKHEKHAEVRSRHITGVIELIGNTDGIYLTLGDGLDMVKQLYVYLDEHGSFDEKLTFVNELQAKRFSHDKDIKAFMADILEQADK